MRLLHSARVARSLSPRVSSATGLRLVWKFPYKYANKLVGITNDMLKMMAMLTSTMITVRISPIENDNVCRRRRLQKKRREKRSAAPSLYELASLVPRSWHSTHSNGHYVAILQTWLYYYLYRKLQMINLTSELVAAQHVKSFIYLCKLITCCSIGLIALFACDQLQLHRASGLHWPLRLGPHSNRFSHNTTSSHFSPSTLLFAFQCELFCCCLSRHNYCTQ